MTKKKLESLVYGISIDLAMAIDNKNWELVESVFKELMKCKAELNKLK